MKHQYPENHSEPQFADFIGSIPKHVEDHADQAAYVEKFVREQGWKVSRILDVGAGEGTFTELVLRLLHASGAFSSYKDVHVEIIEKDEKLWELCESRLKSLGVSPVRVTVADSGMQSQYELPVDQEALIAFSDRHLNGRNPYDLIIASHVTYYFNNAGVELAYALGSRLLDENGKMWFVVRDRQCNFYRFREQLLAKHGLPDIHRECFSDAFLDRLLFLSECPNAAGRRSIETCQRVKPLAVPAGSKAGNLVSYLMWLSELDDGEVADAARLGGVFGGFSETHIWISQLHCLPEDEELRVLAAVNVSASCIDAIRRRVPDVRAHRISLASVVPTGKIPKVTTAERVDLELPIVINKFDLFPVGYACEDGSPGSGELLSNFFRENTSFLFYRRFFHDYQFLSPPDTSAASAGWESHAVIRPLKGTPKRDFPESYPRRSINNAKIPAIKPKEGSKSKPFWESVNDWVDGLSAYYCAPSSGQGPKLWAICIGSNIMPELRNIISKTQELNSSCAIFLTVWTSQEDLSGAAADFVGQIKARLAQWIAESLHRRLRERMDDLDRQAKTMELMVRPLLGISDALARMQSDTQEIRALMFEPEEALFKSHIGIEPFFREGHGLPIAFPGCPEDFRIRHTPNNYETHERVAVLACVMCSVLGKLPSSEEAPSWGAWPAHAVTILNEASRAPSYSRLSDDLRWLVGLQLQPKENLGNILTAPEEVQAVALRRVKDALFSPFKADTGVWMSTAFRLLHRSAILEASKLEGKLETDCSLPICRSPITYAAVLSFVRDISLALSGREVTGRRVNRLGWNADEPGNRFRMAECIVGFDSPIPDNSSGLDHKRLRHTLRAVAKRCPREWRIQDDNYGDTTRPFVYLVNKVIGLGPGIHDDWQVCDELSAGEVFSIRSVVGGDAIRFSIDCGKTDVRLIWAKV